MSKYVVKIKITDAELRKIILQHLKYEGQIDEEVTQFAGELERSGRAYLVPFEFNKCNK